MAHRKAAQVSASLLLEPATRPVESISHARQVCQFYKEVITDIKARTGNKVIPFRLKAVRMRAEFDKNKHLSYDESVKLLEEAKASFLKQKYYFSLSYTHSPGGNAFDRNLPTPDWLLDTWHPLEKAQYPKYFAVRDVRKREFIERFEKMYGTTQ